MASWKTVWMGELDDMRCKIDASKDANGNPTIVPQIERPDSDGWPYWDDCENDGEVCDVFEAALLSMLKGKGLV